MNATRSPSAAPSRDHGQQPLPALTQALRRCADWPHETPKPQPKTGKQPMAFVVSGAVDVLVGLIYGVLDVKSPAPPTIALIRLLEILVGEQISPFLGACEAHSAEARAQRRGHSCAASRWRCLSRRSPHRATAVLTSQRTCTRPSATLLRMGHFTSR
jgi:XapX domain-containing protein